MFRKGRVWIDVNYQNVSLYVQVEWSPQGGRGREESHMDPLIQSVRSST